MLVRNRIPILLQEALCLVRDIVRVVGNCKRRVAEPWLLEDVLVFGLQKLGVELLEERRITAGGQPGLFVEEREDTELALNDVDTRLVVGEVDEGPVDLFLDVLLLFQLEDVRVELRNGLVSTSAISQAARTYLLLQFLVGVVNAELLEGILKKPSVPELR